MDCLSSQSSFHYHLQDNFPLPPDISIHNPKPKDRVTSGKLLQVFNCICDLTTRPSAKQKGLSQKFYDTLKKIQQELEVSTGQTESGDAVSFNAPTILHPILPRTSSCNLLCNHATEFWCSPPKQTQTQQARASKTIQKLCPHCSQCIFAARSHAGAHLGPFKSTHMWVMRAVMLCLTCIHRLQKVVVPHTNHRTKFAASAVMLAATGAIVQLSFVLEVVLFLVTFS